METLLAIIKEPAEEKSFIGYVARFAHDLHTNVHLIYVQEPHDQNLAQPSAVGLASSLQVQEDNAKNANKEFAGIIEEISNEFSIDIPITYSTEIARVVSVINNYISENKASMVILEEEEKSSFWAQSSSTIDVVNQVNCPLWIIPFDASYSQFRKIVYATDYKEEDIKTLKNLMGLTYRFSPVITALHITESSDFEEKIKEAGFMDMVHSKTGYRNISVISLNEKDHENSAKLINDYALANDADLIVVLKENKNFFSRILKPSATKKIIKEARLPVLVYYY